MRSTESFSRPALGSDLIGLLEMKNFFFLVLLLSYFCGCKSSGTGKDSVDLLLRESIEAAWDLHEQGKEEETLIMLRAIARIDPEYTDVEMLMDEIPGDVRDFYDHPLIGVNMGLRRSSQSAVWKNILLYLPDRLCDLFDIISIDLKVVTGGYINFNLTHAAQMELKGYASVGVGWRERRSLTFSREAEGEILIPSHGPLDSIYQDELDYWAVGMGLGLGPPVGLGFKFDLHPLQLADFLGGFVCVDFLNDDMSHTENLRMSDEENSLLEQLHKAAQEL